ncbi:MAG: M23 family metallopeptidase [Acidobacteria bacterium]|nr:M23 family metallopeptidase [Acidobacteriota bacterium]
MTTTVAISVFGVFGAGVTGHPGVAAQGLPELTVSLVTRAMQPGEVVRVDVRCACGRVAPRASALDRDIPLALSPDGTRWQGLIGIDLDVAPGEYFLLVSAPHLRPPPAHQMSLRVEPKLFRTRTLTVAPEYVDPPAPVVDRIVREAARLNGIYRTSTPRVWDRPFVPPLATQASANFGSRSVFNGQPRSPHAGIDFGSPTGTVVTAPSAGSVVVADDLYFTGNTVVLDHGAGLYSIFAHFSALAVEEGDLVDVGATLGRVGATGRVTGPHLHWSVRLNGARVDPISLIEATQD